MNRDCSSTRFLTCCKLAKLTYINQHITSTQTLNAHHLRRLSGGVGDWVASSKILAEPKSVMRMCISLLSNMFSGFRSLKHKNLVSLG